MIFNGASTIGPALAGFGVATLGYAGSFFLNAASFVGVLAALYAMHVPQTLSDRASVVDAIQSALATVRRDAVLLWALTGYATLLFLGPSSALILPVYAVKILCIGPEHLGFLFSAVGLGTIAGALFLASLNGNTRPGRIYLAGIFVWVLTLAAFAVSKQFWISLVALLVFGMAQTLIGTTTITLLQSRVPLQMRGRMMSLNTLVIMGIRPLGDFPAAALIAYIGAPSTVLMSAIAVGLLGCTITLRPAMRSA
jgi:predicted MFS family arabinose efflux permease